MLNIEKRFWSKVSVSHTNQCWEWKAGTMGKGYGQFRASRTDPRLSTRLAHQLSWIFSFGDIPPGMFVLHKCDNIKCVNPSHLFLGTQLDNIRDMISKNRGAKGEGNGMAKLTEVKVRSIAKDNRNRNLIASEYGVSLSVVSNIKNRRIWKHLWIDHEN